MMAVNCTVLRLSEALVQKCSYCVFFEQLFWVASFCQTVLCHFKNLLQLHPWLIKPLHEAAVCLHMLPPLCRLLNHGLKTQRKKKKHFIKAKTNLKAKQNRNRSWGLLYLRGSLQVCYSFLQEAHVHVLQGFTAVHYFLDGLVVSLYHCQTLLTAMCEGRQFLQYSMTSRVSH